MIVFFHGRNAFPKVEISGNNVLHRNEYMSKRSHRRQIVSTVLTSRSLRMNAREHGRKVIGRKGEDERVKRKRGCGDRGEG